MEHAKHVQSTKVLERQLEQRGKRQASGAALKKEREKLANAREAAVAAHEERNRGIAERVKVETNKSTVSRSKDILASEKAETGHKCRQIEEMNIAARQAAKEQFLSMSARSKREVDAIKSGAKSARAGLVSARKREADEVRQMRQAEAQRKKDMLAQLSSRNRQVHDLLYASKFAPRERAKKVNLPGRIGKTAFNAYDADAVAADAALAPAALDANGNPIAPGGTGGQRRPGVAEDGWDGS